MIRYSQNNKQDDPICPICNGRIKKWARAVCDGCGSTVCRRHREMFDFSGPKPRYISTWFCPTCRSRMGLNHH